MATIAATTMQGSGARAVTLTTLTGTDTLTYNASRDPVLILRNPTAGPLTATIDGDGATTVPVAGIGSVAVSSGYSTGVIAIGAAVAIPLSSIKHYLEGTIAITGGTGLVAILLEY